MCSTQVRDVKVFLWCKFFKVRFRILQAQQPPQAQVAVAVPFPMQLSQVIAVLKP